jgi:Family of unknown function (DUF6163)
MSEASGAQDIATTGGQYAATLSDAPIGATRPPEGIRWVTILLAFMRIAACYWLVKGVLHWATIIGLSDIDFPGLRLSRQGIVIGFAVMDIVAAIGLWLTSSWGAAVWLVVLFADAALPYFLPEMTPSVTDALISAGFGLTYLFLVWKAFREEHAA